MINGNADRECREAFMALGGELKLRCAVCNSEKLLGKASMSFTSPAPNPGPALNIGNGGSGHYPFSGGGGGGNSWAAAGTFHSGQNGNYMPAQQQQVGYDMSISSVLVTCTECGAEFVI